MIIGEADNDVNNGKGRQWGEMIMRRVYTEMIYTGVYTRE